jgi:hypothetical protein
MTNIQRLAPDIHSREFNYRNFFKGAWFSEQVFEAHALVTWPVEEIVVLFHDRARKWSLPLFGVEPIFCCFKNCIIAPNHQHGGVLGRIIVPTEESSYTCYGFDQNLIPQILWNEDFIPPDLSRVYHAPSGFDPYTKQFTGPLYPKKLIEKRQIVGFEMGNSLIEKLP